MKKIEAIVQPFGTRKKSRKPIKKLGIDGMTIFEGRGHGRQKGHKRVYRGEVASICCRK